MAPQLLVQITGTLRNLVCDPQSVYEFIESGALVTISTLISNYLNHKELTLNLVWILSKVSNNKDALQIMG